MADTTEETRGALREREVGGSGDGDNDNDGDDRDPLRACGDDAGAGAPDAILLSRCCVPHTHRLGSS